jgi:hypothetical protein
MKENLWLTLVTCLAYCLDKELWKAIDYLKERVRVLKEQQAKDKHILLDNHQRMRLAAKARQLTRGLLEQTTVLFTPETARGFAGTPALMDTHRTAWAGRFLSVSGSTDVLAVGSS